MDPVEAEQYEIGSTMNLLGYTSTSKDFDTALKFSYMDLKSDKVPVVFKIEFRGSQGLFQLTHGCTAYPEEQEVLVQDGLTYRVVDNSDQSDPVTNKKYRQITLSYPAN